MKKLFLLPFLAFLPLLAHAFTGEVEINGINYFIKTGGQAAEVRAKSPKYSGDVVIPSSVVYEGVTCNVIHITNDAFKDCTSLTSVSIPNSVTGIGIEAFRGCTSLTSVSIPNSVTSIDRFAFYNCTSLTSVTIPNRVTSIGSSTFSGCSSLTSVSIPNSVTSIGNNAFRHCTSLTSVTIGSGIQEISYCAFADCPDLIHVYCHAVNVPSTSSDAFNDSYPQYATLHVPDESLEQYKNKSPWSKFGTIIGLSGGGGSGESNKCAKPTIGYSNNRLTFSCETAGATCQYSITDDDVKAGSGSELQLTVTYHISAYATKSGMQNSDVATATLCWIDKEADFSTDISPAAELKATPVLIQSAGGTLTIQGAADGTPISVFTTAGMQAGSAVSQNSMACISTSMQQGDIAIVRIGNRSVKVVLK